MQSGCARLRIWRGMRVRILESMQMSEPNPVERDSSELTENSRILVRCEACNTQIPQTATACPVCARKFDSEAMVRMLSKSRDEAASAQLMRHGSNVAAGCVLAVFLLGASCIAFVNSLPPVPPESEDDYVRRRALQYMTADEYEKAKQSNEALRGSGLSDAEIKRMIDSELRRRGETP